MGSEIERFLRESTTTPQPQPQPKESELDRFLESTDPAKNLPIAGKFGMDPDYSARVLKVQDATKLQPDIIERNLDVLEKEVSRTTFQPDNIKVHNPDLAAWMARSPHHAAVAKPDIEKLSYIERQIRYISDQFREGQSMNELSYMGMDAAMGVQIDRKKQADLERQMGKADREHGITGFFEQIPGRVANQLPIFARTVGGKVSSAGMGAVAGAGITALAGQLGPQVALPEEIVTVPAAATAGAFVGWRVGAAAEAAKMEMGLAYLEFEKLKDDGGFGLDRETALGASVVVGVVNGALEGLVGVETLRAVPGLRAIGRAGLKRSLAQQTTRQAIGRYLKEIGRTALEEGVTEAMQSFVTNAMGELGALTTEGSNLSTGAILDRIFSKDVAAQALEEARAGAQGGGGMATGTGSLALASDVKRAQRAQQQAKFFEAIGQTLGETEMAQRVPEQLQDIVEHMTKDGPIETVYIPVEKWDERFNAQGIDPGAAIEEVLGSREAYDEAAKTGGDIAIPTSRYAAVIAASEHNGFFLEELRFIPGEMSAREAKEKLVSLDTEQGGQVDDPVEAGVQTVGENIRQMLVDAGIDDETASTNAAVWQGVFRTMAQSEGLDPVELFNERKITIQNLGRSPLEVQDEVLDQKYNQILDQSSPDLVVDPNAESWWDSLDGMMKRYVLSDLAGMRPQDASGIEGAFAALPPQIQDRVRVEHAGVVKASQRRDSGQQFNQDAAFSGDNLSKVAADEINDVLKPGGVYDAQNQWPMPEDYTYAKAIQAAIQQGDPVTAERAWSQMTPEAQAIINDDGDGSVEEWIKKAPRNKSIPAGFQSKLETVVDTKVGGRATKEQIAALKSQIKEDEWKWYGMDEFLEQAGDKITKRELQDWVKAHRLDLRIQPIGRTQGVDMHEFNERVEEAVHEEVMELVQNSHVRYYRHGTTLQVQIMADSSRSTEFDIVWSSETYDNDEGGEALASVIFEDILRGDTDFARLSHEEVMNHPAFATRYEKIEEYLRHNESYDAIQEDVAAEMGVTDPDELFESGAGAQYSQYTLPGGENYRNIGFVIPSIVHNDPHWNDEGIQATARVKDRVTPDGKKMLFIEEIQSDLHEQARKKAKKNAKQLGVPFDINLGYATPEVIAQLSEYSRQLAEIGKQGKLVNRKLQDLRQQFSPEAEESDPAILAEFTELRNQRVELMAAEDLLAEERDKLLGRQPDAPFKRTWHELVMKAALRMAAEGGYDAIGWTTGQQQNERYSLDNVADTLILSEDHLGRPNLLHAMFKGIMQRSFVLTEEQTLEDLVGEELAQRLRAAPSAPGRKLEEIKADIEQMLVDDIEIIRGIVGDRNFSDMQRSLAQGVLWRPNGYSWETLYHDPDYAKFRILREEWDDASNTRPGSQRIESTPEQPFTVGGAGMRGFYDGMLVQFAKKFGKKFGMAPKEGEIDLTEFDEDVQDRIRLGLGPDSSAHAIVHQMDLTPEVRKAAMDNAFELFQSGRAKLTHKARNELVAWVESVKEQDDVDSGVEDAVYQSQEDFIRKHFGDTAADNANYGQWVDENDDEGLIVETKIYGHGRMRSTVAPDSTTVHHEMNGLDDEEHELVIEETPPGETPKIAQAILNAFNRGTPEELQLLLDQLAAVDEDAYADLMQEDSAFERWVDENDLQQSAPIPNDSDPIVAAASRVPDGTVFTGLWHGQSEENAEAAGHKPEDLTHEQGFVTKSGKFLTRAEAARWIGEMPDNAEDPDDEGAVSEWFPWSRIPANGEFMQGISKELLEMLKILAAYSSPPSSMVDPMAAKPTDPAKFFKRAVRLKPRRLEIVASYQQTGSWSGISQFAQDFASNMGLGPVEFLGTTFIATQNTRPGEQPYRITFLLNNEPLGHSDFDSEFSLKMWTLMMDLAPVEYRQSTRKRRQSGSESDQPRGRIRLGDREVEIALFAKADLSTFIHESSHFFLDMIEDLATRKSASEQIKKDYLTIRTWLGAPGDTMLTREQHEQFARGFEAHLMSEQPKNEQMLPIFARFRAWLVSVYKDITALNVELTPEVRDVFNRLIMSDTELEVAMEGQAAFPFDPSILGLDAGTTQSYLDAVNEAREESRRQLDAKYIKEMQREQSRQWKLQLEQIRAQVALEVNADPAWRALALLTKGKQPDGTPLPDNFEKFKISRSSLTFEFGDDIIKQLPHVHAREGGVHVNVAAGILGFASGQDLVNSLSGLHGVSIKGYIDVLANERMREENGEKPEAKLTSDGQAALHNDKRAYLLRKEMELLAQNNFPAFKGLLRKVTRRVPSLPAIRAEARALIAAKPIRRVQPSTYQSAERKAGKAALDALLKGDVEGAFEWKHKELLNHELFRAALDARAEVESIVTYMHTFDRKSTRKRLSRAGADYLPQIDALRERFDFRRSTTYKELSERQSLLEFVNSHADFDLHIPEKLLNEAARTHYRELPLNDLREIRDTVVQISHLARTKNRLLASLKRRTLEEAKDAIVASITAHHKLKKDIPDYAPGLKKRFVEKIREIDAAHMKMEFIVEYLDGNVEQGPAWQYLFKPLVDAENHENAMMRTAVKRLEEIFSVYPKSERALWYFKKLTIPGVPSQMTKPNILAVALNQGNAYNKEALKQGNDLTDAQVQSILDTMDRRDWETVQMIWNFIDSYWPMIERQERDLNGLPPRKVEATEVITKHGVFRGGYYPIVFDSDRSWQQLVLDSKSSTTELFGGQWVRAQTRHGHTEERKSTGGKPILLELSGLTNHVAQVVHDLTHRRPILDVDRIVQHPEVRNAIERSIGRAMYKQIHPWLVAVSRARQHDPMNPIERMFSSARMGATVVHLGWKMTTALTQVMGLSISAKELGPLYTMLGAGKVFSRPDKLRHNYEFMTTRSEFMRDRMSNYDRDVRDMAKRLNVAGGKAGPLSVVDTYTSGLRNSWFALIGLGDMLVSMPTWIGAYHKAMDGKVKNVPGFNEPKAIAYADKIVRQTQGVGAPKDLAGVQRGPEVYKLFVMFYSFFSVLYNQFRKTTNQLGFDKNFPRFVAHMALLWFIPSVVTELMVGRGPEDEDDDWINWLAKVELTYPFQTLILVRDVVNGMDNFGYEPSAAFKAFETMARAAHATQQRAFGDKEELTPFDIESAVMAVGYFAKLPTRQMLITGEYFMQWMAGETEGFSIYDALVTGAQEE